jgi:hypothetical protein
MKTTYTDLFEGAIEQTKKCGICKQHVPLSMFGKDGGSNYLRYECKSCAKTQANIIKKLKKSAPTVEKSHKCPICLRDEQQLKKDHPNKKNVWCLDHDHKTNKFRGWLCHKCNLGLGNLNDDTGRLHRALEYLQEIKI